MTASSNLASTLLREHLIILAKVNLRRMPWVAVSSVTLTGFCQSGKGADDVVLNIPNPVMQRSRLHGDMSQGIMLVEYEFPNRFAVPGLMVVVHYSHDGNQFVDGVEHVVFFVFVCQGGKSFDGVLDLSEDMVGIQGSRLAHVDFSCYPLMLERTIYASP